MIATVYESVQGREGILVVHDSVTGEYVGCMGREIWHRLLAEDEPATTLRTDELPRPVSNQDRGQS